MRLLHALLVTVVFLILGNLTCALEAGTSHAAITSGNKDQNTPTRFLQSDKTAETEERGIFSSLMKNVKTSYWANFGKSDAYVKKALNLKGLSESAMRAHPSYKNHQKYLYKVEGVRLDNWVFDEVHPRAIWAKLGLNGVNEQGRIEKLRIYTRYVEKYDRGVYHNGYKGYFPKSETDMNVHLRVWAKADRPNDYVLTRLGIYNDANTHRYYSYPYNA